MATISGENPGTARDPASQRYETTPNRHPTAYSSMILVVYLLCCFCCRRLAVVAHLWLGIFSVDGFTPAVELALPMLCQFLGRAWCFIGGFLTPTVPGPFPQVPSRLTTWTLSPLTPQLHTTTRHTAPHRATPRHKTRRHHHTSALNSARSSQLCIHWLCVALTRNAANKRRQSGMTEERKNGIQKHILKRNAT